MAIPLRSILLPLALLAASPARGQGIASRPMIESPRYDEGKIDAATLGHLQAGAYDYYFADLGIDNIDLIKNDRAFDEYRKEEAGEAYYEVELTPGKWQALAEPVRRAVIREIRWYAWGGKGADRGPLDVWFAGDEGSSPFDRLSPHARERFMQVRPQDHPFGGTGERSYGPNCWYSAISAIASKESTYAREMGLESSSWDRPRFMGAEEFRFHMRQFDEVEEPKFGDIVRYSVPDPLYLGEYYLFGGEMHAGVFIGREKYVGADGKPAVREIILHKDGKTPAGLLVFQDARAMDEKYLGKKKDVSPDDPLLKRYGGRDPRKKGYFRAKGRGAILDPAVAGEGSAAYAAYLVDRMNFKERWDCLAGKIPPPPGKADASGYPLRWMTLDYAE